MSKSSSKADYIGVIIMYTAFIVDDESKVINGLIKHVSWEQLNTSVVGYSKNGNEALNKILDLNPDIVITDIFMPGINGIQLMEQCRGKSSSTFIVFSGYSEFEYAKAAIRLEAVDYLIKPVNIEEIEQTIIKAQKKIDKNRQQSIIPHSMELPVSNILGSNYEDIHLLKPYEAYIPFLLEFHNATGNDIAMGCIASLLAVKWERYQLYFVKAQQKYLVLAAVSSAAFIQSIRKSLTNKLKDLLAEYGDIFYWGMGCIVTETGKLRMSISAAHEILEFCKFSQSQLEHDAEQLISDSLEEDEMINQIANVILMLSSDEEAYKLINLFMKNLLQKKLNVEHIKAKYLELLYGIRDQFYKITNDFTELPLSWEKDILIPVISATNADDAKSIFYSFLHLLRQNSILQKDGNRITNVIRIKQYIQNHLGENINLNSIADSVNMNSAYVSYLFKQEAGMNLFNYITEQRIHYAKHLLKNTNKKVMEIAELCGYDDQGYFCQVFKKQTGMTASEYRNAHG